MTHHWHTSIDNVIIYGLSAILVINLIRLAASHMASVPGIIGSLGRGLGAVVS